MYVYKYKYIYDRYRYDIKDRYMLYNTYMQMYNLGIDCDNFPTLGFKVSRFFIFSNNYKVQKTKSHVNHLRITFLKDCKPGVLLQYM